MRGLPTVLLLAAVGLVGCGGSSKPGGQTGGAGSTGAAGTKGAAGTMGAGGSGGAAGTGFIGSSGCGLFSGDDPWNADVSGAAVDAANTTLINTMLGAVNIHPDFGPGFGIPINVVPANQAEVPVVFDQYPDESDPGPYPLPGPTVAQLEGTDDPTSCSGDCHLLVVQQGTCQLYEGYACQYDSDGWHCGNGAHWDLTKKSLGQRPVGWTSADAAGLSIYAGLARYEEVMAGEITHALRYTLPCSADSYVSPATHAAGHCPLSGKSGPPMGTRVRLKASFDISGFAAVPQIFLKAFKKYGLILADNGGSTSTLFFQSEDNANWPDAINDLKNVPVSAFEAVQP